MHINIEIRCTVQNNLFDFVSVFRKCSDVALLVDLSVGNICHQFGTFTTELLLYWLFQ